MYRILLVETPSYKDKSYLQTKLKFNKNLKIFHNLCLKMKAKISDKFKIKLIGFDNNVKHTYQLFNKTKIIKDIKEMPMGNTKCSGLSLYADYNPKTTIKGTGYSDKKKALKTIDLIKDKNSVFPLTILENYLNEPIVLTKDDDNKIHCLTNVCTHRGNILVFKPGKSKKLVCMYHGRKFNNRGEFEFMPEFDQTKNFPRPCDHLHRFPLLRWGKLIFAGLNPSFDFQSVIVYLCVMYVCFVCILVLYVCYV